MASFCCVVGSWCCCRCRWEVEVQEMEVVGGWCCCRCGRWEVEVQEKEVVCGWCRGCVGDLEVQEVVGGWCRCSCRRWEVEVDQAGLRIRGRSSTSQENLRKPCSNSSPIHHFQSDMGHAPSFEPDSTRVRDATGCTLDIPSPWLVME